MQQLPRLIRPSISKRPDLWWREPHAGDHLPYSHHVDDFTIATRDGMLLQVLQLSGFPFETADSEALNYRKTLRDIMMQSLASSRFALYHHVIRHAIKPSAQAHFPDPFSQYLDEVWQSSLSSKSLFHNDLFLTLVRRPAVSANPVPGFVKGWWSKSKGDDQAHFQREIQALNAARETLFSNLHAYGAKVLRVKAENGGLTSEISGFLSALYNGERRSVELAREDLGQSLPYRRVSFGRSTIEQSPFLDQPCFLGMISVKDYPQQTFPGMLDNLLRLPIDMTISQSFAIVDRAESLSRMNLASRRMRASDDEAVSLRNELISAKDEVAAGRATYGEHHLSIAIKARTPRQVDDWAAEVQAALIEIGAVSVREDTAMESTFWAQFPGNFKYIARRALVSTRNFASLFSGHNFPLGKSAENHWGQAVSVLETTAAGPYYFNFHHGDLGNFTVIGPSGSGKTVVLNFLLAQAQRFRPRIVFFDKDRGAEIFIRAIGGHYDVLKPGVSSGLNPLQLSDTPVNRSFLVDWLCALTSTDMGAVEEVKQIKEVVDATFQAPFEFRRLRYIAELFRGGSRPTETDLAARLRPWWGDGDNAWLFDNDQDSVTLEAKTVGFDMTRILDAAVLRTPTMMYLFHRVEEKLDGDPSIIVVDEGWKALDDDVFVTRLKDWEKTIRKRNGIVGFATQSAEDALQSRIASTIVEQAATQIFMANPRAQAKHYIDGFSLTEHEFDLVRSLPDSSRCFLIKHGKESVVARLNLSGEPELLTVLSGRESTVRRLDAIRTELGDDPALWMPRLMEGLS